MMGSAFECESCWNYVDEEGHWVICNTGEQIKVCHDCYINWDDDVSSSDIS